MIMKTITNPKFVETLLISSVIAVLSFTAGYVFAIKGGI